MSRAVGKLADATWPDSVGRAVVSLYSRAYRVAMDEAEGGPEWTSFDAFFTRGLRDGARPIAAGDRVIVSPSDGRIDSAEEITSDARYIVKGRPYQVAELVGSEDEAARYTGGRACVIYLSPRDYHRVHSPVDGDLVEVRSMEGDYFPVNDIGVKHVPNLFVRNRRVAFAIDTPSLGRVTLVMVSAMIVGRITASAVDGYDVPFGNHKLSPAPKVTRGQEIGVFHLGSTVVLFLEKKAAGSWVASSGSVRYGEPLHEARERTNGVHANGAHT